MKVAYVRVSSADQNEARQVEALEKYGIEKWFVEKVSGKNTNRPKLQEMLAFVREGDTVHIHDLSRLARSTADLLIIVEDFNRQGVHLVSNKENIDSSTPTGKLMLTMIGAINQFERENLLERQREGVAIAKREGKYHGRKPAPLPVYLDDEGIRAEDAELIRDGILTGYMNDRESAERYQMAPKGNARAWTFSDEPIIRMRNTCILPGKNTVEELIASVDDGYYLIESGNGQADLTGEFMFGVTCGYEIKNGKLGRALLDTTVTGVAFDMLKTVDMVSDRVEWCSSGFCGKKQPMAVGMGGPHMRCKIMIGGR